jgi:hypothetical protein
VSTNHSGDLESARLRAEIRRLESESAKLELERLEMERRFNKPWYRGEGFLKTVVGALIAVPLTWFYVTEIAMPLQRKDVVQLAWRNEVVRDSLRVERRKFKADYQEQAVSYREQLERIRAENVRLDSLRQSLLGRYEDLENKYGAAVNQSMEYQATIDRLRRESTVTKQRIGELDQEIHVATQDVVRSAEPSRPRPTELDGRVARIDALSGERLYYATGDTEIGQLSVKGFRRYYEALPDGEYASEVLLKSAQLSLAMGSVDEARWFLNELKSRADWASKYSAEIGSAEARLR